MEEVTSNSTTVYQWDGEQWSSAGNILEERSNVGLSVLPLSSGVMDHCL